jgi:ABC-type amino acid transport substrate-binding protein
MRTRNETWSKLLTLALALLVVAALGACATETDEVAEDGTAMTTEEPLAEDGYGTDDGTLDDTTAMGGGEVDDISTGTELAEDGSIAVGSNDDDFAPGETVYVAMDVEDATAGSNVELVWYGPDGMEAASDSKQVQADAEYLNFEVDTQGWAEGEYRGEVWYNNELVNEFELNVAADGDDAEGDGEMT